MVTNWLRRASCFALLVAGASLISLPSPLHADDDGMEKYRDWLPDQILEMPEEQRRSEVPFAYISSARTADLAIQTFLSMLMYEGLADFEGAKRRFQSDLGEPQTGVLTVGQITELNFRAERAYLTPVAFFPYQFGGYIEPGIAQVRGTAKILDDDIAYPINYVEITCKKSEEICKYKQIILEIPKKFDFAKSYSIRETFNLEYTITRWSEDRIEARPLNEGGCRIPELRLTFSTKEFYEIATNAPEGNCELPLGGIIPKLERPRVSQITDGDPIIRAEFNKIKNEAYNYLSSDFRLKAEAVFGVPSESINDNKKN